MGCQKCWPALSQEEIDRRGLPCCQRCQDEGGCPKCAQEKSPKREDLLHPLRMRILNIYGRAAAFNLLGHDLDPTTQAAKETGLSILDEAREALILINDLQK